MLRTSLTPGESCRYPLTGRWRLTEERTLLVSSGGLEQAKKLISSYKQNQIPAMTPELWSAKKVVDSTLHPGIHWAQYRSEGLY